MDDQLLEITLIEINKNFSIILEEHNSLWKDIFSLEKTAIEVAIGKENITRLNHIGSTFVNNLIAKPSIDILLEIKNSTDIVLLLESLYTIGYIKVHQSNDTSPHILLYKGYSYEVYHYPIFHLHVRYLGDWDELYFRDFLMLNNVVAKQYGNLKLDLKKLYEFDREKYTKAKTEFIITYTEIAKKKMAYKYAP